MTDQIERRDFLQGAGIVAGVTAVAAAATLMSDSALAQTALTVSAPRNDAHAQQRSVVRVALPGTIEPAILDHIGPAFTTATGYPLDLTRAPSIALVNRIVSGELKPDVYISSDANQMKLLFGPAEHERARW